VVETDVCLEVLAGLAIVTCLVSFFVSFLLGAAAAPFVVVAAVAAVVAALLFSVGAAPARGLPKNDIILPLTVALPFGGDAVRRARLVDGDDVDVLVSSSLLLSISLMVVVVNVGVDGFSVTSLGVPVLSSSESTILRSRLRDIYQMHPTHITHQLSINQLWRLSSTNEDNE
jgi:hypothetical protein